MSSVFPRADGFWAVTSYFNPSRYRRRLSNFRAFRDRLNVPLLAIELTFGSDFELEDGDADVLVQLNGGAVLWQKERLLNLAVQALPRECRNVAWLDCDILFDEAGWAEAASRLLERFAVVQLFKHVHYLSPRWKPTSDCVTEVEFTRQSSTFSISSGESAASSIGHTHETRIGTSANGFAWAARREFLQSHGLYDACIMGGGDRAMMCAATNCFDQLAERHYMNDLQISRYTAWARPFYEAVSAEVGYLNADIFHMWHGDVADRATRSRHEGLQRFQFDPFHDIAISQNGCWRWNTDKPAMHDYVRGYFSSRREDG